MASDFFIMGGMLYYLNGGRTSFARYVLAALTMDVTLKMMDTAQTKCSINSGALTTYFPHHTASVLPILPDGGASLPSLPWS
jgi:hypothetical protein